MQCPFCTQPISDAAQFCPSCGRRLANAQEGMLVYNYAAYHAKKNDAYVTFNDVLIRSFLIIFPIVFMGIGLGVFLGVAYNMSGIFVDIGIPLICSLIGIGAVIVYVINAAQYSNADMQVVLYDIERNRWYVLRLLPSQIHGWDTASRLLTAAHNIAEQKHKSKQAQQDILCIQLIRNYQQGIDQPSKADKFWGNQTHIIFELADPKLIRQDKKKSIWEYSTPAGKRKKITIVNAYPGLNITGKEAV